MDFGDPRLIRGSVYLIGLTVFLAFELVISYRPSSVSKLRRWGINLGLTLFNNILIWLIFGGTVLATAQYVATNNLGLLGQLGLPFWLNLLITVLFFDLMLYVWHLLNHVVPLLWRFHRVHHCDKNMDVSTATRFHIGELALSTIIRMGLIYVIGCDVWGVVLFESLVVVCSQFHHSSVRVPLWFESIWWLLFVPPSMHRIHHSVKIKERDSNYGTIFSIWDRFCATMVSQVDQSEIRIGVGGHFDETKLGLGRLLVMPVTRYVR